MEHFGSSRLDIILALVLLLIPWGLGLMGYQVNVACGVAMNVIALLLIIHGLWVWELTSKIPNAVKMYSAVTLLILGGLGIWFLTIHALQLRLAAAMSGELIVGSTKVDSIPRVEIGDSGTMFISSRDQPDIPVILFSQSSLNVEKRRGRLFVSAKLRDRSGKMVAELWRNEWKISQENWDRNYTNDALEIIGSNGEVVLQIRMLPDRVRLQAEWNGIEGKSYRLVSRGTNQGGMVVVRPNGLFLDSDPKIQRIFQYPSSSHFGKLRD